MTYTDLLEAGAVPQVDKKQQALTNLKSAMAVKNPRVHHQLMSLAMRQLAEHYKLLEDQYMAHRYTEMSADHHVIADRIETAENSGNS